MASNRKVVHGDDLLYRFFQSALIDENAAFAAVPQLLLATMGIWLPLDVYAQWPVVLPWVVRDPSCRGRKSAGLPDQWSSPNKIGLLRDDNSMIKSFPRALPVASPGRAHLHGARMGTEFVAAHVWRTPIETEVLASRLPQLNSFVPNLVWLPGQIAKLTDREGSVVQETLQAMSWAIYRTAHVDSHLRDIVEEAWNLLPRPSREISDIDSADLNWFVSTPLFFTTRRKRLDTVLAALRQLEGGLPLQSKVLTTRYTDGLPGVPPAARTSLLARLEAFVPPFPSAS